MFFAQTLFPFRSAFLPGKRATTGREKGKWKRHTRRLNGRHSETVCGPICAHWPPASRSECSLADRYQFEGAIYYILYILWVVAAAEAAVWGHRCGGGSGFRRGFKLVGGARASRRRELRANLELGPICGPSCLRVACFTVDIKLSARQ